jgi:hypothetical protein
VISNSSFIVPVVRGGVVFFRGAGCPWASTMSGAGNSHVPPQTQIPGSGVVTPRAAKLAVAMGAPALERPLAAKAELPQLIDNRKQYVHMTRVVAGGEGAMGPHPEREPV